ncbi:MAG: BolA family transcriptional regulator [Acidobacteria bacterium]|nr:MAG: BolA family transcriptional regulator [Acidobacteriota bacterium]
MTETTPAKMERLLRARFEPAHFELQDDSPKHVGHPGASSGGGHYAVVIVSSVFEELSRLERHRRVHAALEGMIGAEIHALALRTIAVSEWPD